MSFFTRAPKIISADVSLIKIISLPDFISKELRSEFSFLSSPILYSQYYIDLEKTPQISSDIKDKTCSKPLNIPGVGDLIPLRKRHTKNSFWKSFRHRFEKGENGLKINELFIFLPLRVKIPIDTIIVNKIEFPVKVYAYLFPFGSCCVNMQVKINDKNFGFNEFIDLVENLKRSIIKDGRNFENLAKYLAETINTTLFGEVGTIEPFSTHSLIFVKKTNTKLLIPNKETEELRPHKLAIAAIMANDKSVESQTEDAITKILSCKLKNLRNDEIFFFNASKTFLYASPNWKAALKEELSENKDDNDVEEIITKKLDCMRENYESLLNILFAINRIFKVYLKDNKNTISSRKLEELMKCFKIVFPYGVSKDKSTFHYKKEIIDSIDEIIGLQKSFEEIKLK